MAAAVGLSDLLASAFSYTLGSSVLTYDQYKKEEREKECDCYEALDIDRLFRLSQVQGDFGDIIPECHGVKEGMAFGPYVFIRCSFGRDTVISVQYDEDATVESLKDKISSVSGITRQDMRLLFVGKQLEDGRTLSDYHVKQNSTLFMVMRVRGGGVPTYYVDDSRLDPKFDYDFTKVVDDGAKFYRGEHEYYRPYGWERYAIKVLGMYENDKWLGEKGLRTHSSEGEWPVSYHGTGASASGSIAQDGYKLSQGKRFKYGKGIYSTPSINVAAKYAQVFQHKGIKYRLVFQNRVSPTDLKILDAKTTRVGEYWVQPHEMLVRPYGICIQRC